MLEGAALQTGRGRHKRAARKARRHVEPLTERQERIRELRAKERVRKMKPFDRFLHDTTQALIERALLARFGPYAVKLDPNAPNTRIEIPMARRKG